MTRLSLQKGAQLKDMAGNSGLAKSGTKPVLVDRLLQYYKGIVLENTVQGHYDRSRVVSESVLSFDLGYRNLAFCHLKGNDIVRWSRVDLALPSFHPSVTAPLVRQFVQQHLQPWIHEVQAVIIEQQRYRSGGAHTVLESTIRVNSIEAMLWYALGEMELPPTCSMEPVLRASVEATWAESMDLYVPLCVANTLKKKKAGVMVVDGWLKDLVLNCPEDLWEQYDGEKKKDDMCDSLLQAKAWYQWRKYTASEIDHVIQSIEE
ncbi:ribonuclease H-like domain-containing protein [Spinellus fusiger]|nr:ribonuclease H-like domain-containing protein [Spinellus fusiger]